MHELALCDAIARSVIVHAEGRKVNTVRLRVGALRQVVPETLSYCWSVVSRGRTLDGSTLSIEEVPGEVLCDDCHARTTLTRFSVGCGRCGGTATRVVAGQELLIVAIDVSEPERPDVADARPAQEARQ
jgi:hydrogenase nickel incorporation protein HypA/HybF